MLFQTPEFVALLLAVFFGLTVLRSVRPQHLLLLAASYLFYGWWDIRFLMLLLLSTAVDYCVARSFDGRVPWSKRLQIAVWLSAGAVAFLALDFSSATPRVELSGTLLAVMGFAASGPFLLAIADRLPPAVRRRVLLAFSVAFNLGLLGYFKYHNFFAANYAGLASWLGSSSTFAAVDIALPVGISFYTFQTLSYTIDVYRGDLTPERRFSRLALYVSYFPQLVAGPIMRPQTFLPKLDKPWTLTEAGFVSGFHLAIVGLVKKVVIADAIAPLVGVILDDPAGQTTLAVWLGTVLFAIQIYCDFSGYTDIARGVSRMLGVEIPINFDAPYLATSIADFWRRWHISLSTWLRDYLYIPLGGNRGRESRVCVNLMVTMLLGGLWHGAAWNFVIWGGYQGALLCMNRWLSRRIAAWPAANAWLATRPGTTVRWAATMYFVAFGWLIFRVQSLPDLASASYAFLVPDGVLSATGMGLGTGAPFHALLAAFAFVLLHGGGRLGSLTWPERLDAMPTRWQPAFCTLLGAGLFFAWPTGETPFVYFQF